MISIAESDPPSGEEDEDASEHPGSDGTGNEPSEAANADGDSDGERAVSPFTAAYEAVMA